MSNAAIPASLCDLLARLEYLALIQRQQKPCFGDFSMVDSSSYSGAIKRRTHGESRKIMIYQVNQIVDSALESINAYDESEFLILILNSLSKAKLGIDNLKFTYNDDTNIVAQIQVCINKINNRLDKYRDILIKKITVEEPKSEVKSKPEPEIKVEEKKEETSKKKKRDPDNHNTVPVSGALTPQTDASKTYDAQYPPFFGMAKQKKSAAD